MERLSSTSDLLGRGAPASLQAALLAALSSWVVPVAAALALLVVLGLVGLVLSRRRRATKTSRPAMADQLAPPPNPPETLFPPSPPPTPSGTLLPPPPPPPPSPPAPPTEPVPAPVAAAPVAGWYPDPAGSGGARYWNGASWTRHTRWVRVPATRRGCAT